ncbi:rhamnogalacturonan acetylesterase [Lysobacter auxotrophicus]|uniref:Rhamnogalacturonan acetylesterase n=1 Tax=Lysobacter auxotrophicus TaxID=2992573 RepID=A0ABN6UI09_9GAMM|nr:rhamnogalacturonan acetylesterase [Lysobacter auxotrophicus]BDU15223.1 rhamnogalacturonan acetylesterase [Lysobacter auxotrophicus]
MLKPLFTALVSFALLAPARAAPPVTIHLAGDSTMSVKRAEKRPETGWGEFLAEQFPPGTVVVDNRAMNGRSTRTFLSEGRWDALLESTKPGDIVLIQFGHNDQSIEKPDRYTPPADYARNLGRFVADVRTKHATPVLLTPVARRRFDDEGRLVPSHGGYPDLVRALAAREGVALIDMERRSSAVLQEAGVEASKALFLWLSPGEHANYPQGVQDSTHFSPKGAARMAREFAAAWRELGIVLPADAASGAPL